MLDDGRGGSDSGAEVSGVVGRRTVAAAIGAVMLGGATPAVAADTPGGDRLAQVDHIVVIYQENHSFDNLYGGWEAVRGLAAADPAHATQVSQAGTPFSCLLQNDVNLTSPPLSATCTDTTFSS